jgi:hypothetical protein
MAEEIVTILKVGTDEAVQSVADLRDNVKQLKEALKEAEKQSGSEEGWKEYQETLEALKINQAALKDAMYATSGTFDDLQKSATGASNSYNSLVNKMAELKREFRATNDEARRNELGKQIFDINKSLKDYDEKIGQFQRNVGNYKSAIEGMIPPLKGVNDAIGLIGKQPVLGIIQLLAPLIASITSELKDNKNVMDSVKKLMESFKPILKIFEGALQKIAEWAAEAFTKVTAFVKSAIPQLKNVVPGIVGVGNAIYQFLVMPIKQTIELVKGLGNVFRDIFTGQWEKVVDDAKAAVNGINDAFTKGIDFKGNYKAGEEAADSFVEGLSSTKFKKKAGKAGKDVIAEFLKQAKKAMDDALDDSLKEADKKSEKALEKILADEEKALENVRKREEMQLASYDKIAARQLKYNEILVEDEEEKAKKAYEIQQLAYEKRLAALAEFQEAAMARGDTESALKYEQEIADTQVEIELATLKEKKRIREEDKKNLVDTLNATASATSAILGTIAGYYEADSENAEKNANKIKALRIAAATIDTISGALGAFTQASETIPPPYGQIIGAAEAAAITAAGIAEIAKMRSTNVSTDGGASPSVSAMASAPTLQPNVSNVRTITTASEEDRLNQMAKEQRVYILASDIQASQDQIKTQVSESSF